MTRRWTGRLAFGLLLTALALSVAACGGGDDDGEATDTATGATTTDTTETEGPGEVGGALNGSVGPGFEISLTTSDGEAVSTLPPGSYELALEDLSGEHNFHLTGPGVDISTDVEEEGAQSASIQLSPGSYTFVCDPHASQMNGSFEVG